MNNKSIGGVIDKIMSFSIMALAFLLPVFYLPVTTEYFEFNKLALVAAVTIVLTVLWGVKTLINGKLDVTKSPLNLPLILVLITYVASSLFSISRSVSIYGSYGRWGASLITVLATTLLYFIIASNLKDRMVIKKSLFFLVVGTTLSSLIGIFSFFGVKILNTDYAQLRNFTLTGSSLTAAALSAIAIVLAIGLLIDARRPMLKNALVGLILVNFLFVVLANLIAVWALLVVGILAFLLLTSQEKVKASLSRLSIALAISLVLSFVFLVPQIREGLKVKGDYPVESKLGLASSWIVTSSTLRDFPLFGSGPSTFNLDFSHYRPLGLNSTNQWSLAFDKPFNDPLEVMATLGILGFLAYLFLLYRIVRLVRNTDMSAVNSAISAVVLGMVIFSLLSYTTPLLSSLLTIALAFATVSLEGLSLARKGSDITEVLVETSTLAFTMDSGRTTTITSKTVATLFAIPMFALGAAGIFFGYKAYAAEVFMRKAITAGTQNKASDLYNNQRSAIQINPYIDVYHATFAQTNFVLANSLAGAKKQEDLTDTDKGNIQNLISTAIQEVRITTELLNPTSSGNWEQRGRLYSLLTGVAQDANSWAASAYTRAIELDPTNPILRVELGGVYYGAKDYVNAEKHFRSATILKQDYANGHYNLAQTLTQLKRYQEAIAEMQVVASLVPLDSEDYKKATSELATLKAMPEVAGTETNKPSISDLHGQPKPTTQQEPLTNPGAKPLTKETTSSSTQQ